MGNRIRDHRRNKLLTQDELAERVGVTSSYIGMIERGERIPSLDSFILIANELEVTADELLTGIVHECRNSRLALYGEKIAKLKDSDCDRLFAIIDLALSMVSEE